MGGALYSQSHVSVLKQNGRSLDVVGSVDNIAPGERIYSVRFLGTKAYVVTYRTFDPLFAVDLSNPTSPKLAGQLDVAGVSTYLQPVGGGYLVGLGCDLGSADNGPVEPSGLQVSLFNINDLSHPTLVNRVTIPSNMFVLNAFNDHHVVAYYANQGILTVSMPAPNDNSSYYSGMNDLYVFRVDTSSATPGLTLIGTIAHDDSVLRSAEIGGRLISISQETVEVHTFSQPNTVVASLTINPPGSSLPISPLPIITFPIFAQPIVTLPIISAPPIQLTPILDPVTKFDPIMPVLSASPPDAHKFSWTIDTFVRPQLMHSLG
jgi:uncharacterized secreted protein with C-terminal beta-propeller domain